MKIYRGTKNLSPLKVTDYYPSRGQFGEGMYFGSEISQPRTLSFPGNGFRIVATFELVVDEQYVVRHKDTRSQSHKNLNCRVEISEFEVVIKNPELVSLSLESLTVGFGNLEMATSLVQTLKSGTIEDNYGVFDVVGLEPELAQNIVKFLKEQNFDII